MAIILQAKGDLDAAQEIYQEALAIYRPLPGAAQQRIPSLLEQLARISTAKRDLATAEDLYRQALERRRQQTRSDSDSSLAELLNRLGKLLLLGRNEPATAEPLFSECLEIQRRILPEDHLQIAGTLVSIGLARMRQDNATEAEAPLREALAIRRKAAPADHRSIGSVQGLLGWCLTELDQYEEAEPLLIASYQAIQAHRGPQHRRTKEALEHLIDLYEAWDKPDQAAPYRDLLQAPSPSPESAITE